MIEESLAIGQVSNYEGVTAMPDIRSGVVCLSSGHLSRVGSRKSTGSSEMGRKAARLKIQAAGVHPSGRINSLAYDERNQQSSLESPDSMSHLRRSGTVRLLMAVEV